MIQLDGILQLVETGPHFYGQYGSLQSICPISG